MKYVIDGPVLRIKIGFSSLKPVAIKDIRRIEETSSVLASPAASLDRLEIVYNQYDSVIISPKNKLAFISDIKSVNPDIEVQLKSKI